MKLVWVILLVLNLSFAAITYTSGSYLVAMFNTFAAGLCFGPLVRHERYRNED